MIVSRVEKRIKKMDDADPGLEGCAAFFLSLEIVVSLIAHRPPAVSGSGIAQEVQGPLALKPAVHRITGGFPGFASTDFAEARRSSSLDTTSISRTALRMTSGGRLSGIRARWTMKREISIPAAWTSRPILPIRCRLP